LIAGFAVLCGVLLGLWAWASPQTSPWRDPESRALVTSSAPLMKSLVPLIAVIFLLPGLTFGYLAGTFKSHRDVIAAMSKSMGNMSYYLVMAFCAAQFTSIFNESKLGVLTAVKGALFLQSLQLPPQLTVLAIILLTAVLDLLIGSASAKWALMGPILVPMLMSVGISPDLTQAAYRIGDSTINIVTPLMPYFPLVVMYARRYVQSTGVGTLVSLMLPYSLLFLVGWSLLLLGWWQFDLPLGLDADYTWPRR
jgi:aminobenzoyl-glutamate transport protein